MQHNPHPPKLLTDILQKLTLIVLQDLGPPVAIPQSFLFGVFIYKSEGCKYSLTFGASYMTYIMSGYNDNKFY